MPYIVPDDRRVYAQSLASLVDSLAELDEEDLGGHFNYCVSYLLTRLWESKRRYVRANTLRGAVENAVDEWYQCNVVEYEEQKREENGDV